MNHSTIKRLSDDLHAKRVSSVELTQHYLQRIHQHNPTLNSFITLCDEQALAQAEAADAQFANGNATALTGIPIAQKDIFCTDGVKTTCGSKMLDNFIAPYNATIIEKCNTAGMVMLGKTNMDEFAMGSSNETSYYGTVRNPYHLDFVAGGSSGGSAAAVAGDLAPIATGTDTGGSIRQPCSLCNLTGIKPTYGRVSRYGMIAFASSLDQAGPMARTAEDAAMLLNAIAGFDERDSTSIQQDVPDYTRTLNDSLEGVRIGLPKEYLQDNLPAELAPIIDETIKLYESLGATFQEISLPHTKISMAAYYVIAPAECSSNLARFDGIRFGYRSQNASTLEELYKNSRSEAFGMEVKRRILIGTYVLSSGFFDAFYLKAQKARRLIASDFEQAFQHVDALLCPSSPGIAFKIGEKTKDPISMYLSDIYNVAVNLAGLPALSMPGGFFNKMPIGIQLIGNLFNEAKLLNLAHRYQSLTNWHTMTPEGF